LSFGAASMGILVSPARGGPRRTGSFLQSRFWGAFKAEFGWSSLCFDIAYGQEASSLLVLVRTLGGGLSFAYVPHGPELDLPEGERGAALAELAGALRPHLPRGCLFVRFDPPWVSEGEGRPKIGAPLERAAADVQSPDTVLVDLARDEEDILASMKPKWRYNVRLAEKKGVVAADEGLPALGEFYRLYEETSRRDRIALHPERYYRRLFELAAAYRSDGEGAGEAPDLRLWVARHEGRPLAAIVTLFMGRQAVYLYGASSDEGRSLMPAYALQWAAMRAAKASGCACYDMFGIPPSDDPGHPMAGLYRFKTGFGGSIAHRAGSWDYPYSRIAYAAFRAAEAARTWWFKDFKKRLGSARRPS
jgi:lipid II:glycine glycyltransferase (peptidoglycan interpeptide bridge formation enzyme)